MRRHINRSRKKGNPTLELSRDIYGFTVKPQHLQRYREYASIYKQEEAERSDRWEHFLRTYSSSSDEISSDEISSKDSVDQHQVEEGEQVKSVSRVQTWSESRNSLDIVYKAIVRPSKAKQILEATLETDRSSETLKDAEKNDEEEESDEEFYDPDSVDAGGAEHSDNESPTTQPETDSQWREELQFLVRGGVPMALRGELWQIFVGTRTRRIQGHYAVLLGRQSSNGVIDSSSCVVEKWTTQIEKDLPRTFPNHPALDEDGRNALRRLLTAYARHNPDVGYCQAMNFFAALLLLLMPEENAFWTLTGIIDDYFGGYYSEKLLEAQVDQLVFEELARQHFPKLISHLDGLGVQVAWISGPWFLSIFVNVLPWETVLRVWDVLLFEGNRTMLFRTALALLELYAPALLAASDAGDAVSLLQSMAGSTFDSSQLVLTACMGYQLIDEMKLENIREKKRPIVLDTMHQRSVELHLWRDSQTQATISNNNVTDGTSAAVTANGCLANGKHSEIEEDDDDDDIVEGRDAADLEEQVIWLKNELCLALEEKKAATRRAEELEVAFVEMVKEDNRRQLSAKVEQLQAQVKSLEQSLSEKQEQEQAMVQVLLRMEHEQKVTEDARRFAEEDAAAQRHAANVVQEKYENAADVLVAMEKRAVMAESMLEATLQSHPLPLPLPLPQPHHHRPKEDIINNNNNSSSKWNWSRSSSPKGNVDAAEQGKSGLFSRMNWRDRNKAKPSATVAVVDDVLSSQHEQDLQHEDANEECGVVKNDDDVVVVEAK